LEERKKCVRIEGGDGVPWRKGPYTNGEGLGPVLDASRRGAVPLGNQIGEFFMVSRSKGVLSASNVNSLATGKLVLFASM
jgi:hypothetical protein